MGSNDYLDGLKWRSDLHERVSYYWYEHLWNLGHRRPISSRRPKLCSKYQDLIFKVQFSRLSPQDDLKWKNDLHGLSSSRRNDWFWYKKRSNPSSYAKVRAIGVQPYHEARCGAPHQTHVWRVAREDSLCCETDLNLKMISDQKTLNMKVVRLVETVKIAFGLIFIRDRLPPQKRPARCSQFKPNSFGKFG